MLTTRVRTFAAAGVLAGALMTGAVTTAPAQAAATTYDESLGGPIRSCAAASCAVVLQTSAGQSVDWDSSKVNSSGNRWYHTVFPATGWIYCGNLRYAPC
ncbi:hypothetical protein ACGFRB_17455 [Streptomyces sp. NPDC048718]|uniref:hypothetical protein n=1 Tax=Streptomyces sp. NPDC048718 TaxID=3365587 RepID=UPI003720D760